MSLTLRRIITVTVMLCALVIQEQSIAANSAMMDLLKILHDKGSITQEEYDMLRNAALADGEKMEADNSGIKKEIKAELTKAGQAADWASKVKLKGDIRTRYQGQWEDGVVDRHRGRIRYRLGVIAKPIEGWETGAGLASGNSDLRSTNQSFDETFSTKGINLDYAYAQYKINENFKIIAGKLLYKSYLHKTTDLIWDSDINPEGVSVNYTTMNDLGTTFANGGIWVLEENGGSDDDPYLFYGQLGQRFDVGETSATLSGSYYDFRDINALGAIVTDGTNTDYRFDAFSLSGELGMNDVISAGTHLSIFADWVHNIDTDSEEDTGYAVGFTAAKGPWEFSYIYADLEENAWPDILPDSDRFDGLTGVHGHEFILNYAVMKNVTLGLDYYLMENTADIDQNLLQLDVNVKF